MTEKKSWFKSPKFVGTLLVAVAIFLLWKWPQWQACSYQDVIPPGEIPDYIDNFRKTLAQILGGILILIGVYFSYLRLTATEENLKIAQEGQVTERFTRAIEQLGDKRLSVRLGGIYALERIALDSPRDHWTIMEVLTAFVRENAPWQAPAEEGPLNHIENETGEIPKLRADIQAILTVISRRKMAFGQGEEARMDLSRTDLRGGNLRGANLRGANLYGANFQEADLFGSNLEGALLSSSNLKEVNLSDSNLQEAFLDAAKLRNAGQCRNPVFARH